ncbi:hypothetical protein HHI36_000607 [Cryptolaemus montrouzieri]|uniref:Tafazzin family protein n=1 Tax=Cryptolaemus montrouzieri TaxID=559131 RepID=A0ABD2P587_9CUCU
MPVKVNSIKNIKMVYDIDWIFPNIRNRSRFWTIASTITVAAVGLFSKIFISWLSKAKVHNLKTMSMLLDKRPKNMPLVTVSNHHSCFDDPGIWVLFADAMPRRPLTDDEICQLLETEDSGDDGAIDHLLEETDDEAIRNMNPKEKKPTPDSGPPPKKIKSNSKSNKNLTDERHSTSGIKVQSLNEGDSSETNDGKHIVSWDTSIKIGKNGYEWQTEPIVNSKGQTRAKNVVRTAPGTLNWRHVLRPSLIRWSLAAHDICFTCWHHASFFSFGKCVPVIRGAGVYQEAVDFCIELLAEGHWVHVFPEGKVNMTKENMRLKWGVGRMIFEAPITPIILPIWHIGMDEVLPNEPPYYLHLRKKLTFNYGEPIDLTDMVKSLREKKVTEVEARKAITDFLQDELFKLKLKTEELHRKNFC